ncbi:MAG: cell wall hydrolase [Hyphomicrobiales bacterium]|nr:cell wall hydrolase [Hyphomicrobiales bacterium]
MELRRLNRIPALAALAAGVVMALWGWGPAQAGEPTNDLASELRCLALNIYHEARSESPAGQLAVAAVTLNRVAHPRFPNSICEVVRQGGNKKRHACQFSWWCDGKKDEPRNDAAWETARIVAWISLLKDNNDPTGGALYYHADYVKPKWVPEMTRVAKIGRHIYYTPKQGMTRLAHDEHDAEKTAGQPAS